MYKMVVMKVILRLFTIMVVLTGIVYPLVITVVAQLFFNNQANGSLLKVDGRIVGSKLIGQTFVHPEYFHPRPSAAGNGYDAASSNASNFAPGNFKLAEQIKNRQKDLELSNSKIAKDVPIDMLTASGSGLDPHISIEAALFQVHRVAKERDLPEDELIKLVRQHTEFDSAINVLQLNLALDNLAKR